MRQNWKQLILVQAGGAICLPVFIIGHALAKTYGIGSALTAIILGNLLLLGMGVVSASSSAVNRKSTAECAVDVFGLSGKELFSGAMVFSMIGWFAIQLNIMTSSLAGFVGGEITLVLNILLGSLITLVGIRGMGSIEALASLSMPFLIITIGYALFSSSDGSQIMPATEAFTFSGISLVLASGIAAVIDLPTFFRLAKTRKDGILAACLLFGCVLPLVESVGLYLFMQAKGDSLVQVLVQDSSHVLWKIWVMGFLLLVGWTTNNANLYSAAVSLQTLSPKSSDCSRTLIAGALGTFLSCLNLLEHLVLVLDLIGIVLGSMGAVIVFHFVFQQKDAQRENLYAWLIGVLGGLGSYYVELSNPVLYAFIVTLIIKAILKVVKYEKIIPARS